MPFRPALKSWDELTSEEIRAKLSRGQADIAAGRICSQGALDAGMKERFANGQHAIVKKLST